MNKYEKPSVLISKFEIEDTVMMDTSSVNIDTDWGDLQQYYLTSIDNPQITVIFLLYNIAFR